MDSSPRLFWHRARPYGFKRLQKIGSRCSLFTASKKVGSAQKSRPPGHTTAAPFEAGLSQRRHLAIISDHQQLQVRLEPHVGGHPGQRPLSFADRSTITSGSWLLGRVGLDAPRPQSCPCSPGVSQCAAWPRTARRRSAVDCRGAVSLCITLRWARTALALSSDVLLLLLRAERVRANVSCHNEEAPPTRTGGAFTSGRHG